MPRFSYERVYSLIIGKAPQQEIDTSEVLEESNTSITVQDDFNTVAESATVEAIEFTDLHIVADIRSNNKTGGSRTNPAIIKIYNLTSASREFISSVNNYVVLKAGYRLNSGTEGLPVLFTGQIEEVFTIKEGNDIVTTLKCKDGYTPNKSIRFAKSFPEGTQYTEIFNFLAQLWANNGISEGSLILDQEGIVAPVPTVPPSQATADNGWSYSGYLRQAMDDLCKEFYYKWQIVNSKLFVYPKNFPDMVGQATLTEDDIITIRPRQANTDNTSTNVDVTGVEVKVLCEGRLDTSKQLRIQGGDYEGTYRIVEVKHNLAFEEEQWTTTVMCEGLKEG